MQRKTRLMQRISGSLALMVGVLITSSASGITIKHESYDYWHKYHGDKRTEVGLVIIDGAEGCSGTAVGNQWVLTAAHCVDSATSLTFGLGTGETIYTGDVWYAPDTWSFDLVAGDDIALIHVTTPFGSELAQRAYTHSPVLVGEPLEMVGYGMSGVGTSGVSVSAGTKRSAWNRLDGYWDASQKILIYDFDIEPGFSPFNDFLRFGVLDPADFDWETDGPLILEGSVAFGDSGGPDIQAGVVIGVHSWIFGWLDGISDASFNDLNGTTNVAKWADWLDLVILGDGTLDPIAGTATGTADTPIGVDPATTADLIRFYTEEFLNSTALANYLAANSLDPAQVTLSATNELGYFIGPATNVIPEPGTLSLLGLGVLSLLRRRRGA